MHEQILFRRISIISDMCKIVSDDSRSLSFQKVYVSTVVVPGIALMHHHQ